MLRRSLDESIFGETRAMVRDFSELLDSITESVEDDSRIDTLEADHAFLTEGGVFTGDLIETWLDYKRTAELDELRLRPHPHEFELYYDV